MANIPSEPCKFNNWYDWEDLYINELYIEHDVDYEDYNPYDDKSEEEDDDLSKEVMYLHYLNFDVLIL